MVASRRRDAVVIGDVGRDCEQRDLPSRSAIAQPTSAAVARSRISGFTERRLHWPSSRDQLMALT